MYRQAIYLVGYVVVVGGLFVGFFHWRLGRRTTRHPLGVDVKVRRQPGEHLRQQMGKSLEYLFLSFMGLLIVPAGVLVAAYHLFSFLLASFPHLRAMCTLAAPVIALGVGMAWLYRGMGQFMNLKLGLFGERVVADQLEGLKQKGYEVFHDVPCLGGSGRFNLDHVVVGRGVVVVIETKTRRKPKGDKEGHKLSYNGQVLTWPGGKTSTGELEQAQRNADWLRRELKKEEKVDAVVHPVLTFPGWFVNGGPPQAPVTVAAHKMLAVTLEKRFQPSLTQAETDAVVRHLNRLCTNLEYVDVE
jgi:hypothetical protein